MSRLDLALDEIRFARAYTVERLADLAPDDWFHMPAGVTHIAYQVGHLAMAEYRLALLRTRGPRPDDDALISPEFIKLFSRTAPVADPAAYPSPAGIRAAFDRVHERVLAEVPALPEPDWDRPLDLPHRFAKTPLTSLFWCGRHELVHTGQIALLRRLLGKPPLW